MTFEVMKYEMLSISMSLSYSFETMMFSPSLSFEAVVGFLFQLFLLSLSFLLSVADEDEDDEEDEIWRQPFLTS